MPISRRAATKRGIERGSPERKETKKQHKEEAEDEMTEEEDGKGQQVVGEECPNVGRGEDLDPKQMGENLIDDNPLFGTQSTPRSGYGADQSQNLFDPTQFPSPPTILQQFNAQNSELPDEDNMSEPLSDAESGDEIFKGQFTAQIDKRTLVKHSYVPSAPENSEEDT